MEYTCIWLVLRWLMVIIDVRIVSYNRHSSILFKLHLIIIGCIHIRLHGCIQLCTHIYCSQVHRCHSIIVSNSIFSSLKLKKKIGLTLMETIGEWGVGGWNWPDRLIIINHSAFIRVYILQSSVKKGRSLLTLCGQTNVFWICFIKI